MYNPVDYWTRRQKPNKYSHIKQWERDILEPLLSEAQTILDYGPGDGRLFELYEGKNVVGFDIVDTYDIPVKGLNSFTFTKDKPLEEKFDIAVCSKVVLHEPNPQEMIDYLAGVADVVYLSTGINLDADHCFNHNYIRLLNGYKFKKWQFNDDLVYVYKR